MFFPERKASHSRDTQGNIVGMDFTGDDSSDSTSKEWVYTRWAKIMFRTAAMISLASVSMNTPDTFKQVPVLMYITFILDLLVALLFTTEMISKMYIEGLFIPASSQNLNQLIRTQIAAKSAGGTDQKRNRAYFQKSWNYFDAFMLLCIWVSLALQCVEFYVTLGCSLKTDDESYNNTNKNLNKDYYLCPSNQEFRRNYGFLSIIRCPRPLILIRVFRAVLRLQLPQARVKAIFQRSTHQMYNVTVFLLFFMSLYGFLGVQFFGDELNYHCVLKTANETHITKQDLAIPDSYCNPAKKPDEQCPSNMKCIRIASSIQDDGGYAGFESFHISIFTVYQAASQEGWVFIMYRAMDCLASWKGVVYFMSMIFLVAWLVKNVFIAVLIETFAEIRVQFQQMWTPRHTADADSSKIFQFDGFTWKLVPVHESNPRGLAPKFFQETILRSTGFNVVIMVLVLANAITAAALHFNHQSLRDEDHLNDQLDGFYYAEIFFTILFNLEAVFKIWCLGWSNYWHRSLFKFELFLCVGTTIHCIPMIYRTEFTFLSVLRIVRLIKASPMLEDFCFKIFGPARKLGSLILFTTCFLVITSTFSLQLFCFFQVFEPTFDRFSTFPKAFMSMFQILTQKGWVAVMHDTMDVVENEAVTTGVAIYFVFYHLVVTLIVLSLFVAVILDNLELDEDIKKLKQLKLREISAETQQKLPMRLRVFERFPNRPQMIQLTRLVSDFLMPKIRDSFMRQFAAISALEEVEDEAIEEMLATMAKSTQQTIEHDQIKLMNPLYGKPTYLNATLNNHTNVEALRTIKRKVHGLHGEEKFRAIIYLLNESNKTRLLTSEKASNVGNRSLLSTQHQIRLERRNTRNRVGNQMSSQKSFGANGEVRGGNPSGRAGDHNAESQTTTGNRTSHDDIKLLQQKAQLAEIKRIQQEVELRENHPFFDRPLFVLGRESRFRRFCLILVEARHKAHDSMDSTDNGNFIHKFLGLVTYMDWIAIFVTTLSCASMSLETPHFRLMNTPEVQICEYIFFVAMTLEMTFKIFANGLVFTPNALLKDFGGFLDLFIYIISLIFVSYMIRVDVIGPASGGHILMVLRCLRPLRIFCLVPQMRRVVYELVRGFREILMVSVLLVVFMFIFAVYGVHLFGGRLAICNDRNITSKEKCIGRFMREIASTKLKSVKGESIKILVPRVWANPRNFNFDNIGNAILALFEVLSLEGWVEIRDVIKERIGPRHVIYIHLFVFIGCLIGLTLFVGVVIANYSENKGTALLTVDQRRWLDLKGRIRLTQPLQIPPRPKLHQEPGLERNIVNPKSNSLEKKSLKFRCFIYDITQHILFKRASATLVVANCFLLFFPFNELGIERSSWVRPRYQIQVSLGIIFTLFFCIECLLKIIALKFTGYWQSKRNRFDMLVAVLGVTWIILHFILRPIPEKHMISNNFGWFVLMLRFFTIAGRHVTLKMLMLTVVMSMYKSLFIIMSMFLLMMVYALAGVILFGSVKYGDNLGRHANFHNTFRATALLTRIVTGEDWNKIMHDCMIQPPFCRMHATFWETDCGNFRAALIYFCSFYVIITYVMLNVLVAIIMENFSLFYSNDEDAIMSYNDIRNFQLAWNIVDVNRKGVVKAYYVRFLLRLIPRERVGFDLAKKKDQQLFKEMCYEVETLRGGRDKDVSFHDVLMVLAYRTVDITKTLQLEELIAREELEYAIEEEVARQTIAAWIERCIFRNRQKHGQLKFKMHANIERQISTALDDSDEVSKNKNVRIKNQSSITSKSSSTTSSPLTLMIKDNSGKFMENPMDASNERASKILTPQLITNKMITDTVIATTNTVTNVNVTTLSNAYYKNTMTTVRDIYPNIITSTTVINSNAQNNSTLKDKKIDTQYSNDHIPFLTEDNLDATMTNINDNATTKSEIVLLDHSDIDVDQCFLNEEYDDIDYHQPLLLDTKLDKKLCNSVDSGANHLNRMHQIQRKSITQCKSNADKVNNHANNRFTTTTFIDTCLINENATKFYPNKIDIDSPTLLIEGKKPTKSMESYKVTIIENPIGLSVEKHPLQHSPLSPSLITPQTIRNKPTVFTTIKSLSTHNKSRQSIMNKLSKLPDVYEDSDEQGEKRLVYSCINNHKFEKSTNQTFEMDNLKDLPIKQKDVNHSEIDNDLLTNEFFDVDDNTNTISTTTTATTTAITSSSSNNDKIQLNINDISPQHNPTSPLQNEIITNENKFMSHNFRYQNDIDVSKHINDSCDEVKKWWRSQLYPNVQIQSQHHDKQSWTQSNIQQNNAIYTTASNTTIVKIDDDNASILSSSKNKQQRTHKNQPRIISSLASKRRSGAAAVISRRPHQQPRVNNLFDVTIDEYSNDDADNITTVNRFNRKESHILQKNV
ncbi:Sodium leak channel non-selective protein isoform 2 [Schistosoma japonicum]|uniref:Sodium leak channel non-selective protein isoform 2 n=1 Tax=Schistosoma japonicum TaxID=6182 RepID=A0A4Z2CZB1_SCHJA|nr:Sodium leak channel non-selective protein isoform 2 [Schistosoma japonicum]